MTIFSEWIIPVGAGAIENRSKIADLYDAAVSRVCGKKSSIAILGVSGIGKTDLLNHMSNSRKTGIETTMSVGTENATVKADKRRLCMTTIPGQAMQVRYKTLEQLLDSKDCVDGIIYVVGNGFTTLRADAVKQELARAGGQAESIDGFRDLQLAKELEDLRQLSERVVAAHIHGQNPKWMCVAVTKVDLFKEKLQDAKRYYCDDEQSGFVQALKELQHRVGTSRFKVFTLPVCASLQPFNWNGDTIESVGVSEVSRDQMVIDLLNRIAKECKDD